MIDLTKCTDTELVSRIAYLSTAPHLGAWGKNELSKLQAEATKRKIKL